MQNLERVLEDFRRRFRFASFAAVETPLVKLTLQLFVLFVFQHLLQFLAIAVQGGGRRRIAAAAAAVAVAVAADAVVAAAAATAAAKPVDDRLESGQQIERRRNQHGLVAISKAESCQVELPLFLNRK